LESHHQAKHGNVLEYNEINNTWQEHEI
jgi:hypothetical protein